MYRRIHAGLSSRGKVREQNDDRWYADPSLDLYLVCDGMGGQRAGGVAAQLVVELLPRVLQPILGTVDTLHDASLVAELERAVVRLSFRIRDAGREPEFSGMGCTVVAALVRRDQALVMHMGDSRAYRLHNGRLDSLTVDHSAVQSLVRCGAIGEDEASRHPTKSMLTRYVGMDSSLPPETKLVQVCPGDRLLLCTDGLTDMLDDDDLKRVLLSATDPSQACDQLIKLAEDLGGRDNATTLVVEI